MLTVYVVEMERGGKKRIHMWRKEKGSSLQPVGGGDCPWQKGSKFLCSCGRGSLDREALLSRGRKGKETIKGRNGCWLSLGDVSFARRREERSASLGEGEPRDKR